MRFLEKLLFALGIAAFVFYGGMLAAHFNWPVYETLVVEANEAARDWWDDWEGNTGKVPMSKHLRRIEDARYDLGSGLVVRTPGSYTGPTLISGLFGDQIGVRLLSHEGEVINAWNYVLSDYVGEETVDELPFGNYQTLIHGMHMYRNSDLIVDLSGFALVKKDYCGNVKWVYRDQVHHAVHVDEDRYVWTLGRDPVQEDKVFLNAPIGDRTIIKLTPGGERVEKRSILDIIIDSGYEGLLSADRAKTPWHSGRDSDPFHMNDVETLGSDIADAFPQFDAGDIMVSIRNLNTIMVLDRDSWLIKWSMTGPFVRQHDPDFMPDGTILLYDNRMDRSDGNILGRSRIIRIDPVSREIVVAFQGTEENHFVARAKGKQQMLPNGNILIAQADHGRIFEVTPDDEIVWDYVNRWDEEKYALTTDGLRFSPDYLRQPACREES